MKKSDLIRIIKEEIDVALGEGATEDKAARDAKKRSIQAQIKALQSQLATLAQGGNMNESENLNEMPYIGGERGKDLEKAIQDASTRLKEKFPEASASDISKIILSKKKRPELAPEVEQALVDQEEELGGDPKYNPTLGGPQTLRAVEKALGEREVGKRGRKPLEKKTEEPKVEKAKVEEPEVEEPKVASDTLADKKDDLLADLRKLEAEMAGLAQKWKKAEGAKKDEIKKDLINLNAKHQKVEKELEKLGF